MKSLFPGYFKENDEAVTQAWRSSIFVVDANILLSFYRYSDSTRDEFLRILKILQDRLWLPHRAADEYLKNRLTVIDAQEKAYDDTMKTVETLEQNLRNARQHPFVSTKTMKKVRVIFNDLCEELEKNKQVHTTRISNDEIKDSIAELFNTRVGMPYPEERLEEIITDGEKRYKEKMPPGYKDASKTVEGDSISERIRKFGDLILWYQVIDKAAEDGKGIIFITDDRKEDWWERFKGKTIGPRPELVKEFVSKANAPFLMYQADRFLELARENLNEKVSDESLEEIREVRRRDNLAIRKKLYEQYKEGRALELKARLSETELLKNKITDLQHERYELRQQYAALMERRNSLMMQRKHGFDELSGEEIDNELAHREALAIGAELGFLQQQADTISAKEENIMTQLVSMERELSKQVEQIEMIRQSRMRM